MKFIFFIILIFKIIYIFYVDIIPDEAYYWMFSKNLNFSYYDQGPGIGLYIKFFTLIFQNLYFSMKFSVIFSSLFSILFIYFTARLLKNNKNESFFLSFFFFSLTGIFIGSFYIMHDSGLILMWSISTYLTIRFLKYNEIKIIYLLFISIGIGLLFKHTMIFFGISMCIYALLSKNRKILFSNIHFYIAFLILLLIVSPMIYWNIKNNWIGIEAILYLRSSSIMNYEKSTTMAYVLGQFFSLNIFTFLLFLYLLFKKKKWSECEKFLLVSSFILPIFFFFMSLNKSVQANWVYPSYISICILLFQFNFLKEKEYKIYKNLLIFTFFASLILNFSIIFFHKISKIFQLNTNSYNLFEYRYKGYDLIAGELEKLKNQYENVQIATNKYQDSSILSWHLPNNPYIPSINILQKNQYSLWNQLQKNQDYLIVHIQENVCEKSFIFFQPILKYMFDSVEEFPEKDIFVDGVLVKRYQVWYAKNYKRHWSEAYSSFFSEELLSIIIPGIEFQKREGGIELSQDMIYNYMSRKGDYDCKVF